MYRFLSVLRIVLFTSLSVTLSHGQSAGNSKPVIGLLGAFDAEVKLVIESLGSPLTREIEGVRFTTGELGGKQVVVAETGVGKVNAAMTTTLLLTYFHPTSVLFTGIAGGLHPSLQPGDLVISRQTGYYDYRTLTADQQPNFRTRNPINRQLNPAYFPADSLLLLKAQAVARSMTFTPVPGASRPPSVMTGTVVTGDQFVASEELVNRLRTDFQADATEMEGAAVAQVCYQLHVPCLVIRSMSDKANSNARRDMYAFLSVAAANSANLVMAIVKGL